MDGTNEIWLEVTNVRIKDSEVHMQLKGDKADQEPVWWPFGDSSDSAPAPEPASPPAEHKCAEGDGKRMKEAEDLYRRITDGLDKKRTVLASLGSNTGETGLHVKYVRVQFADSGTR